MQGMTSSSFALELYPLNAVNVKIAFFLLNLMFSTTTVYLQANGFLLILSVGILIL